MITLDYVKSKSASKLNGLHPVVLAATERLIERTFAQGVPIVITQGLRTIAEQNELYAQGRTKPGKIVTNARGGYSNHNFGVAIDFVLLMPDGKSVSWEINDNWMTVVRIAKELGFDWGGDWLKFKDYPHLEMTFGLCTSQYRAGMKPAQYDIDTALALINKEVDKVTREEYEALEKRITKLEQIINVSGNQEPPAWALEAIGAAKASGAITTVADKSLPEIKMYQVLFNLGMFKK